LPAWRKLFDYAERWCEQTPEFDFHGDLRVFQALYLGQHTQREILHEVTDQGVQVLVDLDLVRILRVDVSNMQQAAHAHVLGTGFTRLHGQGNESLHSLGQATVRLYEERSGNWVIARQETFAQLGDTGLQRIAEGAGLG